MTAEGLSTGHGLAKEHHGAQKFPAGARDRAGKDLAGEGRVEGLTSSHHKAEGTNAVGPRGWMEVTVVVMGAFR